MAKLNLSEVKELFHETYIHRRCYLTITFNANLLGETWTLASGGDTYVGTVDSSLKAVMALKKLNTDYVIACGNISQTVALGNSYVDQAITIQ